MKRCVFSLVAGFLIAACGGSGSGAKTYSDPFKYCGAVSNQDDPTTDAAWTGDAVPGEVVRALTVMIEFAGTPEELASSSTWRCMEGKVLTCYRGANIPCDKAASASEPSQAMSEYCQQHADEPIPAAVTGHDTLYTWKCRNGLASTDKQPFHADARGFVTEFWYEVPPP